MQATNASDKGLRRFAGAAGLAAAFGLKLGLAPTPAAAAAAESTQPVTRATAIFAGGCFWCMEPPFDKLAGVQATIAGYSGGRVVDPTYKEVSAGGTGHAEVVKVVYDPREVSYEKLLEVYWRNVDPTVKNRQFCDVGPEYRTAIFATTPEQLAAAKASKRRIAAMERFDGTEIHTEVAPAGPFYRAEAYHQNYYRKNPVRYKFYRTGCGRDARLEEIWGGE